MKRAFALLGMIGLVTACTRKPSEEVAPLASSPPPKFAAEIKSGILSPEARLRKLSLVLRGLTPSPAEYQLLRQAQEKGVVADFFRDTIRGYLKSPQHIGKMIARLDELFRLKTAVGFPETRLLKPEVSAASLPGAETLNSMDLLFQSLAQENLSWDTLVTGKTYQVPNQLAGGSSMGMALSLTDADFFRELDPTLPAPGPAVGPTQYTLLKREEGDPLLAGAVTTARFFGRYNTTNLNKNRGRAAAIFRTFLCDDMKAVVTPTAEEEKELVGNAFPNPDADFHDRFRSEGFSPLDGDDKHGSQPACMACHYKLDPLGRAFIGIGNILPSDPAYGKLVYKRADSTLVDYEGRGLGDILKFMTRQPEYASCQVSHFWRWFIRGDELPAPKRMAELVAAFDRVGRRTNDFIEFLLDQPEFRFTAEAVNDNVTLLQTKGLIARCDSCHGGVQKPPIPPFLQFPIGGTTESHRLWLGEMVRQMDLAHDGKDYTMPPVVSAWQPDAGELMLLKRWVAEGAKGEDGVATIDLAYAQQLLEGTPTAAPPVRMEFRDSYLRYLRTHDLFRLLGQKFPRAKVEDPTCVGLQDSTRGILGDANPFNGELGFRSPSLGFIRWYGKCLIKIVDSELNQTLLTEHQFNAFYGPAASQALMTAKLTAPLDNPKSAKWSTIPMTTRQQILSHLIAQMVGPGVLAKEATERDRLTKLLENKGPELTCFDAIAKTIFYIGSSDVFLVY